MHNASIRGNPFKQLWSAYERQLERRPVLTQMTTSALLWSSGDLIAQRLEHWEQQREAQEAAAAAAAAAPRGKGKRALPGPHPSSSEVPAAAGGDAAGEAALAYDWRRAVMTGLFGATFVGPVGHVWYQAIDKWCARLVPGGGPAFIATKVLLDTAAMGPFYVAAFFAWGCALIDGSGMSEFKRKMAVDFVPTLAAEVTLWPVIQAINFSCVPLKHQLLVVNTMTIFDACFMSWARNQEDWLGKARRWLGMPEQQQQLEEEAAGRKGGARDNKRQLQVVPLKAEKKN